MPSNTTRIVKNTLMLYFRQLVSMLVSLYAVRIVLEILGVEDFGIYNVVGGVVVLFAFLNNAMTTATQRFLNFALGQNDTEQVRDVYSVSLVIHALIALLVIVLAQTVGLWLFRTWLNIPPERQTAAFVVYQFSVATTAIGILQVPYGATIIAHEKMSVLAKLSIVNEMLRLGIVFLLPVILLDKLIVYAFLVGVVSIISFLVKKIYCNRTFKTAHFRYCRNKDLYKQIVGFSGWSLFGGFANIGNFHGTSILLNIFHGVTINAAMGIATRVNTAIYSFVGNFQTAFRPQLIKSYAANDYDYFMRLIFRTSKTSFCLLLFFVLPLYLNADFVLQIWLGYVPGYAVILTRLILLSSLIGAIAGPLVTSIQATGDIKKYQLIISCFIFANVPLSLIALWLGFSPAWVLIIRLGLDALILVWRIFFLSNRIKLPIMGFFREVIVPILILAVGSVFITAFIHNIFISDWSRLLLSCVVSTLSIGCLMYRVGLNKQEKDLLKNWIRAKMVKP